MERRAIGSIQDLGGGKYRLRVSLPPDEYGRRKQPSKIITATSPTDAERQLQAFEREKLKIADVGVKKVPGNLIELYDEFKENHMSKLRPNTQDYYKNIWDRYLKSFGKTKLKAITPKMIYDIMRKAGVGARTTQSIYGMLRTMLKKAFMWGYIDFNPCDRVEPPQYKSEEKKPYTEDEIKVIVDRIQSEPLTLQLFFYFSAMLGMRRSEIIGLKWSDIDFGSGVISIKRSAAREKGKGTYTDGTKNARSTRMLNIPDAIIKILKSHKAEEAIKQLRIGSLWINEDWVFTAWDGEIMHIDTPSRVWNKFLKANPDIDERGLHTLRHTAATLLIKNNVDISTVSGILGHSQISTTLNIYTHTIEDAKKEALKTMDTIFTQKTQAK